MRYIGARNYQKRFDSLCRAYNKAWSAGDYERCQAISSATVALNHSHLLGLQPTLKSFDWTQIG